VPKPEVTDTQTGDDERFSAKFDFCTERIRFGLQHFDWEEFCDTMFERSLRDIQRLIKLAIADDPASSARAGQKHSQGFHVENPQFGDFNWSRRLQMDLKKGSANVIIDPLPALHSRVYLAPSIGASPLFLAPFLRLILQWLMPDCASAT
jgi:hypothetical protein